MGEHLAESVCVSRPEDCFHRLTSSEFYSFAFRRLLTQRIAATLKAILIAASFALADGDMLSVILISAVFILAHWCEAFQSEGGARRPGGLAQPQSMAA